MMMIRYHTLLILLFLSQVISCQITQTGNIMYNGVNRNYRLRLPANHDKNTPIPLIFNMHGFTSNATQQEVYSGMNAVADTAGFAVCYPNGIGNAWNVGWNFGSTADDVGFIAAMIQKFHTEFGIDKQRVYACGMSNGGFMSYRLACELNDKIAAIASVTGSMVKQALDNCKPGKPVPVMEIHGTADNTVNYNGTPFVSESISKLLGFWQKNNGCDSDPAIEMVPNKSLTDNTTSEKWVYSNCDKDKDVIHFKVINGGHTWPGSLISTGATSQDFNASAEIWNFFKKYKLEDLSTANYDELNNLKVFPNPVSDILNISVPENASIIVSDICAKVINSNQNYSIGNTEISTINWLPGIYIVKILAGNAQKIFKVIKI